MVTGTLSAVSDLGYRSFPISIINTRPRRDGDHTAQRSVQTNRKFSVSGTTIMQGHRIVNGLQAIHHRAPLDCYDPRIGCHRGVGLHQFHRHWQVQFHHITGPPEAVNLDIPRLKGLMMVPNSAPYPNLRRPSPTGDPQRQGEFRRSLRSNHKLDITIPRVIRPLRQLDIEVATLTLPSLQHTSSHRLYPRIRNKYIRQ